MSLKERGYADNVLRVNLANQRCTTERLDPDVTKLLLGGKGLGAYYLYKESVPHADPLSPENPFIFVVGPLTGTSAPTSGRFGIVTKSPATHTFLDSYCGGFFGQTMKFAGYDVIIVEGASSSPLTLVIDNDHVHLEDAKELWGTTTADATKRLKAKHGEGFQTVVIGPAGERLSPISGLFNDERTAGRGGAGAVLGSKKLKGIAVRGTGSVQVHNPVEFDEAAWVAYRMLRMSNQIKRLNDDGTANILGLVNAAGALPTRNYQEGQFEHSAEMTGEVWRKEYWTRSIACYGCPITCSKIARAKTRDVAIDGPDFETIWAMGANCGITDKEAIIYSNYLCDLYGVDTISVGNIVGFVMELVQKKMISAAELDGVKAEWGNGDALVALTEKIAKGEGIGQLLQKGVREISKHYPGSEDFAMQVKGLEMPAYHPNAAKGIGLSYAVSERGACHLRGSPLSEILGGADPLATEGKAELFQANQSDTSVIDALILCYFVKFGITLKEILQMVNACTGFEYKNPRELEQVGERITVLARLFNTREGFSVKDDILPKRALAEPLPSGPAKGHVMELEKLRTEYYHLMGWDENGIPTEKRLVELGLKEITG
ncbi:aldehyde ferredoxin oxidoreductase [bacterium]|nr:MAG: aldehyde ferredoxin oxidoreductase [bacterium]